MSLVIHFSSKKEKDLSVVKEDLLKMLDQLKERVEAGEITGLGYAAVWDGSVTHDWISYGRGNLSMAISLLNQRYHQVMLSEYEEE